MHQEINDSVRSLEDMILVRSLEDIPEGIREQFFKVPQNLEGRAKEILGDADTAAVTRDTQAGKAILDWRCCHR